MTEALQREEGNEPTDAVDAVLFDYLSTETRDSDDLAALREEHPDLMPEIERRLAWLDRVGFLDEARDGSKLPGNIGGCEILGLLGQGGMGTVYLAEQRSLGRKVAVKVLHPHLRHSPRAIERFRREAVAASRLEHAGICPIHDVGEIDGTPYLVMRYVAGTSLMDCIARSRASGRSRVELPAPNAAEPDSLDAILSMVESLARALHAAHKVGLVHRDVKPGNVILGEDGAPVLLDFGLALLDQDSALTLSGDRLGTPLYMAPETVAGGGRQADARTDVYALGVVLYECLTLRPPFEAVNRQSLFRQILEDEPVQRSDLGRLGRDLRIVLQTALAKEPDRRYRSAAAFADDLRAVRRHEPIAARPAGPALRLRRFIRRSPLAAGFVALLMAALAGAVLLIRARDLALEDKRVVEIARRAQELAGTAPQLGLHLAAAAFDRDRGDKFATRSELYAAVARSRERARLSHDKALWGACFSPYGQRILSWSDDHTARLWRQSGDPVAVLPHEGAIHWPEFSPDGSLIVTASFDGTAGVWNREGKRVSTLDHGGMPDDFKFLLAIDDPSHAHMVHRAVFSPDGDRILTTCSDRVMRIWDAQSGELLRAFEGHEGLVYLAAAWSPTDRDLVATAVDYGELRPEPPFGVLLWRPSTGEIVRRIPHDDSVPWVAFSPDGRRLLAACHDGVARIFDLDGAEAAALRHEGPVWRARWSTDGRFVVTASDDGTAKLWRADGTSVQVFHHGGPVYEARFAQDGTKVLTAAWDGARWFELDGRERIELRGHGDRVMDARLSPDGRTVVTASWDGSARLWSAVDFELPILDGHGGAVTGLALCQDGSVVSVSRDRTARFWDLATLRCRTAPIAPLATGIRVSPDGTKLLVTHGDAVAHVHSVADGEVIAKLVEPGRMGLAARWLDDESVVTGGLQGKILRWELDSSAPQPIGRMINRVEALDVSPDGERLAAGSWNRRIALWVRGDRERSWPAHDWWITCVAFDPSGNRLASGSADRTVRLWGLDGAALAPPLRGHDGAVTCLAWSPDGTLLASGAADNTVRLWRARDGTCLAVLRAHTGPVRAVLFLPDGRLLTSGDDGTIRAWPALANLRECAKRRMVTELTEEERERFAEELGGW